MKDCERKNGVADNGQTDNYQAENRKEAVTFNNHKWLAELVFIP
jgi:hypothetical protein